MPTPETPKDPRLKGITDPKLLDILASHLTDETIHHTEGPLPEDIPAKDEPAKKARATLRSMGIRPPGRRSIDFTNPDP